MSRHEHTADRGDVSSCVLKVMPGAADLVIHAEQAPDRLFTARFESPQPAVSVAGGTVRVRYRYSHLRTRGEVALAPTVRWAVELRGGAHKVDADLTDVPLAYFDIDQGANLVTLRVSPLAGWVPVRIGGGASHVTIVRPSTAGARLHVQRGAAHLVFDGQHFGAVGGEVRMESPQAGGAGGYDIHVGAGARYLTVATATRPSG
jgi:hypothetical protein